MFTFAICQSPEAPHSSALAEDGLSERERERERGFYIQSESVNPTVTQIQIWYKIPYTYELWYSEIYYTHNKL